MKRKLKLATWSLVTVMLTGMIAGCSSSKTEESNGATASTSTTPAPSTTPSNVTKDPYEIAIAIPAFGAVPKDIQLVQDEINKITKAKINATVKILPISIGAWSQQMNLMTSGREKLDLFFEFGQGYSSDVATGKIVALDNLLDKYGAGIKKQIDSVYLNSAKIEGKTYGVPVYKDYTTGVPGVLMRKDLVDKYKINVASIKTIDDLDQVYKTIKDNEPTIAPLGAGLSMPSDFYVWYDKLGDRLGVLPGYDNGLKVVNLFETKEYEDYLNKVHSWAKAGFINKDAATTQANGSDLLKADKAFSYFIGLRPGNLESETRANGKELVFAPLMPNIYATTSTTQSGLWTVSANSTNPERVMMLMNLMYTDKDLANLFVYGIEGKHYVKTSDTAIDYPQGVDAKTVGYSIQSWIYANPSLAYLMKSDLQDMWKLTAEANQKAIKSKAIGFTFNSEPVKNEVIALKNVTDQYAKGLESGLLDPSDKLSDFRAKLKAAGIDKVIAEKQKQLDAWAAVNKK
ncbi:ABC transporter substrate-binding protein [Paenibacillus pectinilyticus]|uniref:ABC transporter substrate-binding protein n=1 Tax=Paenibacillus pectinilyticus TaxID=512399 RepID=A0A1C0ZTP6_9BACL|nr:ABC transporter substrate-binding protein [Paenibacillus pectinilyticus]OCT11460.1 ABC transporter substrate-binding protein [Paenibacillus pectinilyticus]